MKNYKFTTHLYGIFMSNIIYGRDEILRYISSWSTIMGLWDDKKSHEIDTDYFQPIFQSSRQLMDLSEEIHTTINKISAELDGI